MRAAVYYGHHDLRIEEVPDPPDPADDEVVVAVRSVALCGTDAAEWDHGPRLTKPPVILGHEFMGEILAVGRGVADFSMGERVVSGAGVWCGSCAWCKAGRTNLCERYYTLGLTVDGGLADFVRVPAKTLAAVPDELADDAAALAQPQAVALHAVRRSGLSPGQIGVVIGVGGIGAFVVAAAASREPSALIAVDVDPARLDTATLLGATHLIDATKVDVVPALLELTDGLGAHVAIETSGASGTPSIALASVRRGGRAVIVGLQAGPQDLDLFTPVVREIDLVTSLAHVCQEDLPEAIEILARRRIAEIVLGPRITLPEVVPSGLEPLHSGKARGKIIVDPRRTHDGQGSLAGPRTA
jgi:(R,R)-butanediol dehydrogenase/meso-butanediol dehydrogenase/diacetyl reductase